MKRHINNLTIRALFTVALMFFVSISYAQFDKKISFNLGGGAFLPIGPKIDADSVPYVFPNFKYGYQVLGGAQYNLNPNFSIGLNFLGSFALNYQNPIPAGDKGDIVKEEEKGYYSYLTNLGLGIDVKYKFFPTNRLNPYLYFEVNGNYYYGEVQPRLKFYEQEKFSDPGFDGTNVIRDKYTILRYNAQQIQPSLAFGIRGGLGLDLRLSDTFTLFVQGGYSSIYSQSNPSLRTSMDFFAAQAGIRFSVFKSKSIL